MQNAKQQELKSDYALFFYQKVQNVVIMRKNLRVTQAQMAFKTDKSLSTIQNFEKYDCMDYSLIFYYEQILNK